MTLSAKYGVRLTRNRNCFSPTGTSFASVAAIGRGAAGAVVDQRHFAENAAFRQSVQQPVAEADLDTAGLDDEQLLGRIALLENDVARLEASHRCACPRQNAEIDIGIRHSVPCCPPDYCNLMTALDCSFMT